MFAFVRIHSIILGITKMFSPTYTDDIAYTNLPVSVKYDKSTELGLGIGIADDE